MANGNQSTNLSIGHPSPTIAERHSSAAGAAERATNLEKRACGPGLLQRLVRRAFALRVLHPLAAGDQCRLQLPHQLGPVAGAELKHHPRPAEVERHALAPATAGRPE